MIGAKDVLDKALVKQYSNIKTYNFTDEKVSADDMWKTMYVMSLSQKVNADLQTKINIPTPIVKLKTPWAK